MAPEGESDPGDNVVGQPVGIKSSGQGSDHLGAHESHPQGFPDGGCERQDVSPGGSIVVASYVVQPPSGLVVGYDHGPAVDIVGTCQERSDRQPDGYADQYYDDSCPAEKFSVAEEGAFQCISVYQRIFREMVSQHYYRVCC